MQLASQMSFPERGTPLIDATFIVVDLETSGLDPSACAITEIGAVKVCGGEVIGEFASFVKVDTPLPAHITAITGITNTMLAQAPPLSAVLPQFLAFAGNHPLVAHNAPFDVGFLKAAVAHVYDEPFTPSTLDTVKLARRLLGDEVRNFRLGTLARRFGSPITPDHRALTDARATVHVFHALIERAAGFGVTTVDDLHALTRARSTPQARRRSLVKDAPHKPGVYRFVNSDGQTLYVGKATDLKARLATYFGADTRRRVGALVKETAQVCWDVHDTVVGAEVHELRAIIHEQPRFNVRHRRGERHVDVALTKDVFPRFTVVTHDPEKLGPDRLGPFVSARSAQQFVRAVTDTTGLRDCTMRIRKAQNHAACIRKDVDRCPAPCDGTVDRDGYQPTLMHARAALSDPQIALDGLRELMAQRAEQQRFEEASALRDALHHLAFALARLRTVTALRNAGFVVAVKTIADGCETVAVRDGMFLAAAKHNRLLDDTAVTNWASQREFDRPATASTEETMLLARWLFSGETRIVSAEKPLTLSVAGARTLHETIAEGREVRRSQQHTRRALEPAVTGGV